MRSCDGLDLPERNPNPVFVLSPSGEVVFANPASATLLRAWQAEPGAPLPPERRSLVEEARAPGGREAAVGERWFRFLAVEADARLHVYGHDVTDARRSADCLQACQGLATLGALLPAVAHDFNQVLSILLNTAELLSLEPGTAVERACGEEIREVCARASWLTHQLLVASGRRAPRVEDVDLAELVRRSEPLVRRLAAPGVHVLCHAPARAVRARADSGALFHVLLNLVTNALRALDGAGLLLIRAEQGPDGAPRLRVVDTGPGVPSAALPHIFEPGFTTRPSEGAGLGLSTALHAVRRCGGDIHVDTTPGEGTTVTVTLQAVPE
ncbi:MAG: HAMP domain-containing histidine kinase [Planctomycetes bacterium]|nr:HAMP domain-containing histidine kinase [Planctomycetota bacterium]